jgi:hypothetical protein
MNVKAAAADWAKKVVELHKLKVPPYLEGKKQTLIKRAELMKKTLEATDPLQGLAPVASELGFVPLIVAGGIAAVTAMSKWAKDAYQIKTEKEKYDALIKSGLTPAKAQEVMTTKGFNWKLLLTVPAILLGGFLVYKITKARGSK